MRALLVLGGIFGPALFTFTTIIAALLRPEYSHVSDFISGLGATGSPDAWLMNYVAFVPTGLLIAGLALVLLTVLPRRLPALAGAALMVVFGLGVTASGLFSCDLGCPQDYGSVENLIHNRIAPVAFLSMIGGIAVLGYCFRGNPYLRPLSAYSWLTSIAALAFLAALVGSLETRELTGLWQRLLLGSLFAWCMAVSWHALRAVDEE